MSQAAVARVLTEHLQDSGERDEDPRLARQLKDTVRKALTGERLTETTLRWFVEAFDMAEADAQRLRDLLYGATALPLSTVRGRLVGPPGLPAIAEHETVSLSELHTLGADGVPVEHRTLQVLRALRRLESYPYRFDTQHASVEVLTGGTAGPLRPVTATLSEVPIHLGRPLEAGETVLLEYRTRFSYPTPPEPRHRRAALRRVERVTLRVQFHADRLPAQVWWAVWSDLDGPPEHQEPVGLEPDHSVHRLLGGLEAAAVGFHWRFLPALP